MCGLVVTERSAIIAAQSKRPRLVRLGEDLRPISRYTLERGRDVHSIAERDGVVFAGSTGRNEILSICWPHASRVGREGAHLRAARASKDVVHLNSVCFAGETLLCSMFGPRNGALRSGALVSASSGTVILDGICDPHSLVHLGDGAVAYCESLTASFCVLGLESGEVSRARLEGYTRGCAFTGRHFVVGSSRWRHRSRSMGSLNKPPFSRDLHGNPWQRSTLYFLNPDLSVAHCLDFTLYAPEIYDVAYVGDRFASTSVFRDAAGRRLDALYDEIHAEGRRSPASDYYSAKRA